MYSLHHLWALLFIISFTCVEWNISAYIQNFLKNTFKMKNVTMKYVHIFQCPKLLRSLHYLGVNFKAEWQKLGKCLLSIFPEAVLGRVVILGMFQQKYSPNLPCLLPYYLCFYCIKPIKLGNLSIIFKGNSYETFEYILSRIDLICTIQWSMFWARA